jgi:hypothetical protein
LDRPAAANVSVIGVPLPGVVPRSALPQSEQNLLASVCSLEQTGQWIIIGEPL